MDKNVYYIWLQTVCGLCSSVYIHLFPRFDSAEAVYACDDFGFIKDKYSCAERLYKKDLSQAFEIYKKCLNGGIGIINYHDVIYPSALRRIQAPPAVLYVKGNLRDLNGEVCVSIVGTRKCTAQGEEIAGSFAYGISKCGAVVISGLAEGIDAQAHAGALKAGGFTVGVLGTPIDKIYPVKNTRLFYAMYERGMVISEQYPGCPGTRADFPNRNRIISALSEATLIAEAGENSGALITAKHALSQGKKVYAIPGAIGSVNAGTNSLIKTGYEAATTPLDIMNELALKYPDKINTEKYNRFGSKILSYGNKTEAPVIKREIKEMPPEPEKEYGGAEGAVLALLKQKEMTTDEIAEKTGENISDILAALTMLEIEGKIIPMPGNKYAAGKK